MQTGERGSRGWLWIPCTLHVCSELACFLKKKLHFRQQRKQQQYKISSLAVVVSQSLQIVCRKDFSNWILSFKSFCCKSCWTGWFSYLLITQYIFFTAARRESSHIWADSQDMGSTSRSLIFHGSWEQHCPLWELSPRVQLYSFSHGGWHCKGKRVLSGSINICTHICVLASSPLFSVFHSGAIWGAEGVGSCLCWSPPRWCSVAFFVPGGLSLAPSAPRAISSICTAD